MSARSEWSAAAESQGHQLRRGEDGEVDYFAFSEGWHNGPKCERCKREWCWHCTAPADIDPCIIGAAQAGVVTP